MLTLKIKICQMQIEKEEINIWKIIVKKTSFKKSHLINRVEELENVCFNG